MGFTNEENLFGYALIFGNPSENFPLYCHKIYVYEQYRGNRLGSKMLAEILAFPNEVGLLWFLFMNLLGCTLKEITQLHQSSPVSQKLAACMRGFV